MSVPFLSTRGRWCLRQHASACQTNRKRASEAAPRNRPRFRGILATTGTSRIGARSWLSSPTVTTGLKRRHRSAAGATGKAAYGAIRPRQWLAGRGGAGAGEGGTSLSQGMPADPTVVRTVFVFWRQVRGFINQRLQRGDQFFALGHYRIPFMAARRSARFAYSFGYISLMPGTGCGVGI